MNDYKKYWIWLSTALGPSAKVDEILSAFPEPHKLFESTAQERLISGVFTRRQLEKLNSPSLGEAVEAMDICDDNGWQIVTPDDRLYPAGLRKTVNMPLVLFVNGDISCLRGKVMTGVVGTRDPSFESIAIARKISGDLASAGVVVVSGGAKGIDSAAHEGSLDAGGKTVCVLGCGLGTRYLMENEAMRRRISENGAVISEFLPYASASRMSFPQRNRIISGISHGVLVVEAGEKSGSLITAECAKAQGRAVFAIPGSVLSTAYMGANSLIRDGANAATCAKDILKHFVEMYPDRIDLDAIDKPPVSSAIKPVEEEKKQATVKKECPTGLDPDAEAVYNLFGEETLSFNEICALSGMAPSRVIPVLMNLVLDDYIEETDGKYYTLK